MIYEYLLNSLDIYSHREIESYEEFVKRFLFETYQSYIQKKRNEIKERIDELAQIIINSCDQLTPINEISEIGQLQSIDSVLVQLLNLERKKIFKD